MQVCLFDIDGTLINTGRAGRAAFYATLEHEFQFPAPHHDVAFSGRTDRSIVRDLFHHHEIENTPENTSRFFTAYWKQLPLMLNGRGGVVLPGVEALLVQLAGRQDVAIGLLTGNTQIGAGMKLGHFGLMQYFSFGGYGDQHLDRNHVAAEALQAAGEFLGKNVEPTNVWVIGDTPLDIRCARAIGAHAVAVATGGHSLDELAQAKPDLLLADLDAAEEMLGRWS
ncbi:MAG: HAD hydrolase-like protein [Planctomycetes bacterium]|nr:HAD hydrolase-like protein [Planctomycetota bacterium]